MRDRIVVFGGVAIILLLFAFVLNLNVLFPIEATSFVPPERDVETNGTVVVEEFSDFGCPYCKQSVPVVKRVLEEHYTDIEFRYRHFPVTQLHPQAWKAAEASECARDQNSFWPYHDLLFENQGDFGTERLVNYASALGLDTEEFRQCLESGEKNAIVQRDFQEGRSRGVQGTPTFFINGKPYVGVMSYNEFEEAIENAE